MISFFGRGLDDVEANVKPPSAGLTPKEDFSR
jgi:hypothetical protein